MIAFQSTLPAWGETRSRLLSAFPAAISIHSPRMGRDRTLPAARTGRTDFNPLSPHGERLPRAENPSPSPQFQSTLPAWGETWMWYTKPGIIHFNPLSPHGERPQLWQRVRPRYISIHSPRMGRDQRERALYAGEEISIHSPRMGRDHCLYSLRLSFCISIHSPRMGRDSKRTQLFEEKNWRICTTLYLFASKGVLPADKKTF